MSQVFILILFNYTVYMALCDVRCHKYNTVYNTEGICLKGKG